jgi:hypothetical protein
MKAYILVIFLMMSSTFAFAYSCDSVCLHESEKSSNKLLTYVGCWVYKSKHCFARALGVDEDQMMHGNYCGSGRLGDGFENEPVDALDKACQEHDKCYHERGDWHEDCDRVFARDVWDLWVKLKADSENRNENTKLSEKAFIVLAGFGGRTLIEDLRKENSDFMHRPDYEKALNDIISLGLQMTSEQILSQVDLGESEEGKLLEKGIKEILSAGMASLVSSSRPYIDCFLNKVFGRDKQNENEKNEPSNKKEL